MWINNSQPGNQNTMGNIGISHFRCLCSESFKYLTWAIEDTLEAYCEPWKDYEKSDWFELLVGCLKHLWIKNTVKNIHDIEQLSPENLQLDTAVFFSYVGQECDVIWKLQSDDIEAQKKLYSDYESQIKEFIFSCRIKNKVKNIIREEEDEWFIYDSKP
jgi:hypothetical protein